MVCYENNWEMAHNVVQEINTQTAYWLHAYLHRIEGDISNAHFWYNRARKEPSSIPLKSELDYIIQSVFS